MNVLNDSLANTPVHFLAAWLQGQIKSYTPPSWKGGWERWAQGQVALYLDSVDGYVVWTEEKIYKDAAQDACDLNFKRNNINTFCELKCYSATNDDTPNTFIKNIYADFQKVQTPLYPALKGSTMWVIGLSQKQFRAAIEAEGAKNAFWKQNFQYVSVRAQGPDEGTSTFDIWFFKYVNNQ